MPDFVTFNNSKFNTAIHRLFFTAILQRYSKLDEK